MALGTKVAAVDLPPLPHAYCNMARQFLAQLERTPALQEAGLEALNFYAGDFREEAHPHLLALEGALLSQRDGHMGRKVQPVFVVRAVRHIFTDFGYNLPASFYQLHLLSVLRGIQHHLPPDISRGVSVDKRAERAALRALGVLGIQRRVQSIGSQFGLIWEIDPGGNYIVQPLGEVNGCFHYDPGIEGQPRAIRNYLWTLWWEYTIDPIVPYL